MRKLKTILSLLITVLLLANGCATAKDEMSRAQQEIDTRQYQQALERLERLGEDEPEIQASEEYIDLLSSAYLGKSGVDLIDALGHWAETYQGIQGARAELRAAGGDSEVPLTFLEYKAIVQRLVPPDLNLHGMPHLTKALKLCNERLRASEGPTGSKRILVKTVFVNFWALINELNTATVPAVERLLERKTPRDLCDGFAQATGSSLRSSEYARNLAMAAALLGDHGNSDLRNITELGKLTSSLNWLEQYPSCEQLTDEDLKKIKQRFARG
ncbi:MAG: hypothetical protein NDJ89_08365 [Oligoflexia bacterium]|nr:hypothetical protein [Oligoflexia bacterium]